MPVIFKVQSFKNVLPEWLATHQVRQYHTAETEKYAHVTFFFNGGREEAFPLEDRGLVASPKVTKLTSTCMYSDWRFHSIEWFLWFLCFRWPLMTWRRR